MERLFNPLIQKSKVGIRSIKISWIQTEMDRIDKIKKKWQFCLTIFHPDYPVYPC
jgi:hypothetical protein